MGRREHGVVLTYVNDLGILEDCVRRGGYDTVKVITGWGVDGGWSQQNKQRVLAMAPNIIVRSVTGDPSYADGSQAFPDPNHLEQEMQEWYALKPDIRIEIGNEPNIKQTDEEFFWKYRYHVGACVERCRQAFPKARLISPAPIIGPQYQARRFWEVNQDVMQDCDFIGIHFYEYYGFHASQQLATTSQLKEAIEICSALFPKKSWYVTEYGINDSKDVSVIEKGRRYASTIHFNECHPSLPTNVKGAVYYHLGVKGDLHPEYHIYPSGDESYCHRRDAGGEGQVSFGLPIEMGTTATTDEAIFGPLVPRLAEMIAKLAEEENEATSKRAEKLAAGSTDTLDYVELRRVQALRATLEVALACAQGRTEDAAMGTHVAMSQVQVWGEEQAQQGQ
jgi:hypothetical protein